MYKDFSQIFFSELIGTFIFVFLALGSVNASLYFSNPLNEVGHLIIALGHGLGIIVGIIAIRHISGAHLNPAITIAMLVTGKTDLLKTVLYISGQVIGASLGASVIKYFVWSTAEFGVGVHSLAQGVTVADGIAIEFFLTFILVFTFFSLGFNKRNGVVILPFAIGTIYLVDSLVAIPLTGASMNPARSFGPSLIYMEWNYHWLYWLGPILGGIVGSSTYVLLFGTTQEKKSIGVIKINGKSQYRADT